MAKIRNSMDIAIVIIVFLNLSRYLDVIHLCNVSLLFHVKVTAYALSVHVIGNSDGSHGET